MSRFTIVSGPAPLVDTARARAKTLGAARLDAMVDTENTGAVEFWERAGFVALAEQDLPFAHLPLTSDHLDLAFHQRRTFDAPLLVFECADVAATMLRLNELDMPISKDLPRGLNPKSHCLIESPEGTGLLIVPAPD